MVNQTIHELTCGSQGILEVRVGDELHIHNADYIAFDRKRDFTVDIDPLAFVHQEDYLLEHYKDREELPAMVKETFGLMEADPGYENARGQLLCTLAPVWVKVYEAVLSNKVLQRDQPHVVTTHPRFLPNRRLAQHHINISDN